MAPVYLPRVPAFPIVGEKSVLTVLGTGLTIPASVQKDCPLIGKMAPEINLPDHLGRRCSLHATIALGRPIILFFFPLAGSPHCTKESCMFRDALGLTPIFAELQAIVIGISQDPPARSKRFVDEHHLGYQILHDERREAMDTYGVPRTMMGLIDQRCTFVLDPNGTVRSMMQGVFDADNHVQFAEKWLIRLEHDLSQRSRQMTQIEKEIEDLMLDPVAAEQHRKMRIAYGDANSASIGGIDAAPRYGAASMAAPKPPRAARKAAEGSVVQPKAQERNMWKQWRAAFAQLSSPDDQPPPVVLSRHRDPGSLDAVKSQSLRSSRKSSGGSGSAGMSRSRSASRLKDVGKGLRRGSALREADVPKEVGGSVDSPMTAPPVPPLMTSLEGYHGMQPSPRPPTRNGVDSESSDRDASTWGTDSSLSSHVSTAATSSLGSRHGNGSGIVLNGQHYQLAKPSVTSEVLMPGEVLDLQNGPPPLVVRSVPSPHRVDLPTPTAPTPHALPTASQTVTRKAAPVHQPSASGTSDSISSRRPSRGPAPQRPPRTSSRSALPVLASSSSLVPRSYTPTDVPQDESEEETNGKDDEEYISQSEDGVIKVLDRPPSKVRTVPGRGSAPMLNADGQIEQITGRPLTSNVHGTQHAQPASLSSNVGQSSPREGRSYDTSASSRPSSPRNRTARVADDDQSDSSLSRSTSSTYQTLRAQRHRSASITDGVFRISTPTLADAALPAEVPEAGQSLSPRPRSGIGREPRLRRPVAPPKDPQTGLARQVSQLSLADSVNSDGSVSPHLFTPSDQATIQRVVRKASLRAEQPMVLDRSRVVSAEGVRSAVKGSVEDPQKDKSIANSLTFVGQPMNGTVQERTAERVRLPFADGTSILTPSTPPFSPTSSKTHVSLQQSPARALEENDMRRPSVSSMGTFGRRGSADPSE